MIFAVQSSADLLVNMAVNDLRFNLDIFGPENALFPAHNIQRTTIFLGFDKINSKNNVCISSYDNTIGGATVRLVLVRCRISMTLHASSICNIFLNFRYFVKLRHF